MKITFRENEFWYGGYVYGSSSMPVAPGENEVIDLRVNLSPNQAAPLLLSSKGRYIWGEEGFLAEFRENELTITGEVQVSDTEGTLKDAYLEAMRDHFPFGEKKLDERMVRQPVYNTWIELTFYQNEKDVLKYAHSILENDLPAGILMIDDGWSDYYGRWTFSHEKFPHAKEMIAELHQMGFTVMLWLCPFVTADTLAYRQARDMDILIKNTNGKPMITEWWNGYSASLDLSNPEALRWLKTQLDALQDLGVDGFKFDAGDCCFYPESMVTKGNVTPGEMCRLWCTFGEQYTLNEFRAAWKAGGMALMQRLCDKPHDWSIHGVNALLPDTLAQGILGMPFGSPDMIGGGEYLNFQENSDRLDEELFVRHGEIACLLPVMQFSAAPWRVLKKENFEKVRECVRTRENYSAYIERVWHHAEETGEPIVRYMEYEFPGQGMEQVNTQFMLGDRLLVAPICEKGNNSRYVDLPEGKWEQEDHTVLDGGKRIILDGKPGHPICLWKIED